MYGTAKRPTDEQVAAFRGKLREAFKAMRRNGIWARQNWKCCMSCGYAAIEVDVPNVADRFDGVTFYHRQDAEDIDRTCAVYLAFSAAKNNRPDDEHVAVGRTIARCAIESGLSVEWNGTKTRRIRLFDPA